jgi:hypothetical protein
MTAIDGTVDLAAWRRSFCPRTPTLRVPEREQRRRPPPRTGRLRDGSGACQAVRRTTGGAQQRSTIVVQTQEMCRPCCAPSLENQALFIVMGGIRQGYPGRVNDCADLHPSCALPPTVDCSNKRLVLFLALSQVCIGTRRPVRFSSTPPPVASQTFKASGRQSRPAGAAANNQGHPAA